MHSSRFCVAHPGRLAALALTLLLANAGAVVAATVVIQPSVQDAFVLQNQKNRVTGATNFRVRVQGSVNGNSARRGFIQFPLESIPRNSIITSAVVGLYAGTNAGNPTLTHGLFRLTAPWNQSEVKWNNQPSAAGSPTATALVGNGRGFKDFDVTADVQEGLNACTSNNGWLIRDVNENASNDSMGYISREEKHASDLPNRPRLVVTFTPPPCTSNADCQDENLCTTNERCEQGACVVTEVNCDDGNPCTTDVCDCATGCRHQADCSDGLSCTTDTCDPVTSECTFTPNEAACDGQCSTGQCIADPDSPLIDDPNTGCHIETVKPEGTPCDDGQTCTGPDTCNTTGTCAPGPKDCHDPVCGSSPICAEQCDNCIDDNGDGLIDRADPACAPVADGDAEGAGDPKFHGKPVLRCQKAIRAAGGKFASQLRTRLQKCTDGVFLCLQQKPGDAACLAKAQARCLKQTAVLQAGPKNLETRLGAKIIKGCGPKKPGLLPVVSGTDLCDDKGLGFRANVSACQTPQSAVLLTSVTSAIAEENRCRTLQMFAADVPRAAELLTAGGVDITTLPCLTDGAQGGNLGLGQPAAVLKAVVNCQRGIATAGAKFANQIIAAEQRCTEAIAQCIQTKPGNAKCLTKAKALCVKVTSKLYSGPASREAKLRSLVARSCGTTKPGGTPRVALGDLRSVLGLGYDSLRQSTCTPFGVPSFTSLDDVSECLVRQHVCRADQILISQNPRAHELLEVGGAVGR